MNPKAIDILTDWLVVPLRAAVLAWPAAYALNWSFGRAYAAACALLLVFGFWRAGDR